MASKKKQKIEVDSSHTELLYSTGIGIVALLTYILTLYPTVSGGDSGELIAAACNLGVAHPPGYPLFTLLVKFFTWIPVGTIAWRANALSAVCDAFAAAMLTASVFRISRNAWAGIFTGGLFAFSSLVWSYAVQAEVFPLNNLLVATLIYIFIRFAEAPQSKSAQRFVMTGALVTGLGLSNHHTFVIYAGPIALMTLYLGKKELFNPRTLAQLLGMFLAGLLPYLYLVVAPHGHPLVSWGDSSTWSGFLTHILRKEYGTTQLAARNTSADFWGGMTLYSKHLFQTTLFLGPVFALWGWFKFQKQPLWQSTCRILAASWIAYLIIFHALANFPLDDPFFLGIFMRFWQQADLFIFIFAGLGFAVITKNRKPPIRAALVITLIGIQLCTSLGKNDQHRNWGFKNMAEAFLKPLPPRTLFLSEGDLETNTIRYIQSCEKYRSDVIVMDRTLMGYAWGTKIFRSHFPEVTFPGDQYRFFANRPSGGYLLQEFLSANIDHFTIFMADSEPREDESWKTNFFSWPHGLSSRVYLKDGAHGLDWYEHESSPYYADLQDPSQVIPPAETWDKKLWDTQWEVPHRRALGFLNYALDHGNDYASLKKGSSILESLIQRDPAPTPSMLKNLGVIYQWLAASEPDAAQKASAIWSRYLQVAPASDPAIPQIRNYIAQHQ